MKEFHKPKKMDIYKENKHQHAKLSFIERNSFISKTNKVSAFIYIYIYIDVYPECFTVIANTIF